jgi:glycosyltransferase involved in cell wall biosynthesis
MKRKIVTITFNDLSISWGPAVHYLELWDSFYNLFNDQYEIIGYAPYWENNSTIIPVKFKLNKIKVPNIPLVRQLYFDFILAFRLIKHRQDIVYIRMSSYSLLTFFTLKLLKIKPILELNGISAKDVESARKPSWYKKIVCWNEIKFLQQAKGSIAVSEGIEIFAKETSNAKTITINNGIANSFFLEKQHILDFKIKIIYVGTFTPWDGAKYIPHLADQFPNIEFHMYGDGTLRKEIEANSPANIIFHGYVKYNQLKEIYSQFDAGIVIYEIERNDMKISSLKTLEYMATGLPIFTTDIPGQEFIKDNQIGMCIDIKNIKNEFEIFISILDLFKENINHYRKVHKNDYSWDGVALKTEKFISEI